MKKSIVVVFLVLALVVCGACSAKPESWSTDTPAGVSRSGNSNTLPLPVKANAPNAETAPEILNRVILELSGNPPFELEPGKFYRIPVEVPVWNVKVSFLLKFIPHLDGGGVFEAFPDIDNYPGALRFAYRPSTPGEIPPEGSIQLCLTGTDFSQVIVFTDSGMVTVKIGYEEIKSYPSPGGYEIRPGSKIQYAVVGP